MSAHDTPEVGSGEAVGEWVRVYPLDDVALATCSGCDRSTWSAQEVGRTCSMRQPDGSRCAGQFTPASPNPVQLADAGEGLSDENRMDWLVELLRLAAVGSVRPGADTLYREQARAVLASDWLAAREAAWAERYAAVVGERDALQVRRTTSPCGCRHPLVAGCDHSSAEAALATALREKAEDRARVEAVLVEHRFMARNSSGRMGCRGCAWTTRLTPGTDRAWVAYVDHLRAALAIPTATGDE